MKATRTDILAGLIVLALLIVSVGLGYVFLSTLDAGMPERPPPVAAPPPEPAPVQAPGKEPAVTESAPEPERRPVARATTVTTFGEGTAAAGPGGEERKYAFQTPGAPPPQGTPGEVPVPPAQEQAERVEAARTFAQMPLSFEPECARPEYIFDYNRKGSGYDVSVGAGEIILHLRRPELERVNGEAVVHTCDGRTFKSDELAEDLTLRMRLEGINTEARGLSGADVEPPSQHLVGTDPKAWFTDVPASTTVKYPDIYPGVDLMFYGGESRFEFMFLARYGADPSRIRFSFEGNEKLVLDDKGNLVVQAQCAKIVTRQPLIYQIVDNVPYLLDGAYALHDGQVQFDLRTREAEDDQAEQKARARPVLDYLSFLGGEGMDRAYAVAADGMGYAYVAGSTTSPRFPSAGGAKDRPAPDSPDVFVTKFRIADSSPVYTTFLGGNGQDRAFGIAVDANGCAYVCGETTSQDFPVSGGPGERVAGRGWDAFVAKLKADGSGLDFSFRLGGRGDDRAYGIALDGQTNVCVAGETLSPDLPVVNGLAEVRNPGGWDGFLARISATGQDLLQCTRVGGSADDSVHALAVEPDGTVYLAGETSSADFPLTKPYQKEHAGGKWDAFLMRVSRQGTFLDYSTYLGGANDDRARGVAVDLAGQACAVGETASGDFPCTNALQPYFAGGDWDMFAARFSRDGAAPIFSTYLGGAGDDRGLAVGADIAGNVFAAGATTSTNWCTVEAVQSVHGGGKWDGVVTKLDPDGLAAAFSTYLGGPGDDALYGLTVDPARCPHVVGATSSRELPSVNALQKDFGGGDADALLAKFPAGYRSEPDMKLVSAGGQPGGPNYDFFMARYEVTNEEWARFLNDAQANAGTARGTNMHFDAQGGVWLSPAMVPERDEMFSIAGSRILYRPEHPVGSRYAVSPALSPVGGSYSNHPIVGVAWYGAVKYCNWLTIDTGRGADQRCYREGSNTVDWAPVTVSVSNWNRGFFDESARAKWLELKGYRLPMDNSWGTRSLANPFNEFYKAAAWAGSSNMPYGYGRETVKSGDANYLDNGLIAKHDTTPVGFFNGSDHDGKFATHSNDNFYGIFDLSGNAVEWLNDPGQTNVLADRGCYGGSWMFDLPKLTERQYVSPHFTDRFRGFRVVTTAEREEMLLIRIPYYICLCGRTGAKEEEEKGVEAEVRQKTELKVEEREDRGFGVTYEKKPEEKEEEEKPGPKRPKKPKKKEEVPMSP